METGSEPPREVSGLLQPKLMILPVSITVDVTWAVSRANRSFTFKAPKPNTKTTHKGMCLKPQAVPARGKKPACFVLKKLDALCDGNPPNVHKIWPERTEQLRSSH